MTQFLLSNYIGTKLLLKNRVVLAPITRCMATDDQYPSENMALFYKKRAGCGLLVTEATCISRDANAYDNTPGIYTKEQALLWKPIVENVHEQKSTFFMQLWHAGMMGHSRYRNGALPLSPSGIMPLRKYLPRTQLLYERSKSMDESDFDTVQKNFVQAAQYAVFEAGFDGIELHAANGYLLDSFLHYSTNIRKDRYGKTPENMTRFILKIIDTLEKVLNGYQKIGVRISPIPPVSMQSLLGKKEDEAVFQSLLEALSQRRIAYVHVASDDDKNERGWLSCSSSEFVRKNYTGTLIIGGNYAIEEAEDALKNNRGDLIYFGRKLIANPNLVQKLSQGKTEFLDWSSDMIENPPLS